MHKELGTIKIISDYLRKANYISDVNSVYDIHNQFSYIMNTNNIRKFNALYILNYIKLYIANDDVAKRKTSARIFEDLISILFDGVVTDNNSRKNISIDVPDYFANAKDKIAGNKREKVDILFRSGTANQFGISVKTLMFDNFEINMGSFERKVLFDGFNVSEFLRERKSDDASQDKKGLGSKAQLQNLLTLIETSGNYERFKDRFIQMFDYVFHDDLLILIKNTSSVDIHFISGQDICNYFRQKASTISDLVSIVNRWEGNSIRIDRRPLLNQCTNKKITLDLSILDTTIIKDINKFDKDLHEAYVSYFNERDVNNNEFIKNRDTIVDVLNEIFDKFDVSFSELKL